MISPAWRGTALLALFSMGCVEYGFKEPSDVDPVDTAVQEDTAPPEDTDTAPPVDTDTAPPVDTDTAPPEEVADAPVYANTSGDLYEIDPLTGDITHIGSFHTPAGEPVEYFLDIAIDPSGIVYGGTYDAIYRIHPLTAEVEKVCDTDIEMMALAFTSDGVLIAGGDEIVNRVDVFTCQATPLVQGSRYLTSGDLVGLPDGYLYWTVEGENGDELVQVDPDTGATLWIGEIGAEKLFGLGYDEGQGELYGFSSQGMIVKISPDQAGGDVLTSDSLSWWGATTNPVAW